MGSSNRRLDFKMTEFPYFQRFFSVEQANQLLEVIRPLVAELIDAASELLTFHPQLEGMLEKAVNNGGIHEPGPALESSSRVQDLATQILSYDVLIKDIQNGLIDFPSRRDGRVVLLCWRFGEPEVAYWHEIETGYAGRQPV